MTNEQEIVWSVFGVYLNDLKAYSTKPDRPTFKRLEEVRDRAIKALESQPCEDCISREQAVYVASGYCAPQNIADELRKLPSVTPRTKSEEAIHAQGFVEGVKACIEKLNEMGG